MEILIPFFFFVFGTIVGSFLNVVILRYNTGAGLDGRSKCFSCGKTIKWYDLIPLFSFIFLGGKCRFCESKISAQYPAVEFFTGVIFTLVYYKFSDLLFSLNTVYGLFNLSYFIFILNLIALSILVVITVYDLKHKIIPDLFVVLFGIISLLLIVLENDISTLIHFPVIFKLLAGPIIALPLSLLWVISKGEWIGLGDSKLVLGMGWFLGLSSGLSGVVIGFWIGAFVSLFILLASKLFNTGKINNLMLSLGVKNLTMKSEIPLGPFLVLGFLIVYFCKIDVLGISSMGI